MCNIHKKVVEHMHILLLHANTQGNNLVGVCPARFNPSDWLDIATLMNNVIRALGRSSKGYRADSEIKNSSHGMQCRKADKSGRKPGRFELLCKNLGFCSNDGQGTVDELATICPGKARERFDTKTIFMFLVSHYGSHTLLRFMLRHSPEISQTNPTIRKRSEKNCPMKQQYIGFPGSS
jgi:hypothetical protein